MRHLHRWFIFISQSSDLHISIDILHFLLIHYMIYWLINSEIKIVFARLSVDQLSEEFTVVNRKVFCWKTFLLYLHCGSCVSDSYQCRKLWAVGSSPGVGPTLPTWCTLQEMWLPKTNTTRTWTRAYKWHSTATNWPLLYLYKLYLCWFVWLSV